MSAADAAWIGLDRPEHLMVVTVVLRLGERVDRAALAALVSERLLPAYPSFRQRPEHSPIPLVPPVWRDDAGFDLATHVREVDLPASADASAGAGAGMPMPMPMPMPNEP